jgi:hypothetical protein
VLVSVFYEASTPSTKRLRAVKGIFFETRLAIPGPQGDGCTLLKKRAKEQKDNPTDEML